MTMPISPSDHRPIMPTADFAVFAVVGFLLALRLVIIAISPLGLDVEEAQYWQWSTTPDLGYFTKPPMIAWLIGLSTSIFGSSEFGVRAFAPIMQAVTAIIMVLIGRNMGGASVGRWAAVIWISLPVTTIGGFIISTDSPMISFLLMAMLLLSPLAKGQSVSTQSVFIAGLMMGAAMMAKYAAVYFLVGLAIWWLWQGRQFKPVTGALSQTRKIIIFALGAIAILAPNLVWNLNNGFVTVGHLGDNANLDETVLSATRSLEFIISQMGVVGPVIAGLAVIAIWRMKTNPTARFWIALGIPALVVVTTQSFRADANANWALASWPPLIILTAMFIAEGSRRIKQIAIAGVAVNASLVLVILLATIMGHFGPLTPASDPLRRLRGWDQHYQDLAEFTATHQADAIVTTRRAHIAKMIWQHRNNPLPIELLDTNGIPQNHFEQKYPWQAKANRTIILINQDATPPNLDQVTWQGIQTQSKVKISTKRDRVLVYHLGVEKP